MPDRAHIHVTAKNNQKLEEFMKLVNENEELAHLWRSANINAVDRSGMSDHGPVHVQIVANAAYKMLRLLLSAEIQPNAVTNDHLTPEDSAIIVVAAGLLHDIGISIQRENHEFYSVLLARDILKELLTPLYSTGERATIISEILHCIVAHQTGEKCLTIEAGVVKVADALDMTQGRSRIPFEAGEVNIHSVSAQAIESVDLNKGENKPIHIAIRMNNYAGIFQLDELLKPKLLTSCIAPYVEVTASIAGEPGHDLGIVYSL